MKRRGCIQLRFVGLVVFLVAIVAALVLGLSVVAVPAALTMLALEALTIAYQHVHRRRGVH